jgi:hypothetical protein
MIWFAGLAMPAPALPPETEATPRFGVGTVEPVSEKPRAEVQAISHANQRHQKANAAKNGNEFQGIEITGRLNGA